MAITIDDFSKIWASTSPLTPYEFSESQYKDGWNFIGGTPPSRQMWDFLQKNNDEKMQYLANNYLPLSGGTMTGDIKSSVAYFAISNVKSDYSGQLNLFSADGNDNGAYLTLNAKAYTNYAGSFLLHTGDGTNTPTLIGKPDGTLTWNNQPLLPVGIVQAFAGTTIPNGWLLCDGSAVSRTDYAKLYSVIGDTYGAGDGTNTFNVPNLIDKFVQGNATSGTEHSAGLPDITGQYRVRIKNGGFFAGISNPSGAFYSIGSADGDSVDGSVSTQTGFKYDFGFQASRSNAIYGNSTTVQPPSVTMRYIIKY